MSIKFTKFPIMKSKGESQDWIFWRLTLRRPLRRKVRMRWSFDISEVKESSFFFKSDLNDPPSDFWCASFGNYRFKPFQISFFSGFYTKIMIWVRCFYRLFERMRLERKIRCRISDESALIHSFLRNGRVRVKFRLFARNLKQKRNWK